MSFVLQLGRFLIHVHPNEQWSREEFMRSTPHGSIALDGMVKGGPFYDEATKRLNLDHHDGVKREATMSTCMQMFFALKGDMMDAFTGIVHVYINDIDQDVALAVWQLVNYALFEGTKDVPSISRLRTLTDRIDITSCAFPMKLSDRLNRQHSWVFGAYQSFRSSGEMASASASSLAANLEATLARLDSFLMNNGEERELNVDHVILYDGSGFKVIDERGCGNDARAHLFSAGMKAHVSIIATKADGATLYTIGRKSQFIQFPLLRMWPRLNALETSVDSVWGGGDLVGGSRGGGFSVLPWERVRDEIIAELAA